jgi:hypothetical protein
MTSIIVKKLDHYQSTQSYYQIDDLTIHLSFHKICCEHVYLSQNDEILISHKDIKKEITFIKTEQFFVNKILN